MARLPDPERSRAVLIGTSRYTDPSLPALPAVRGNLEDLAAVLTDPAGTGLRSVTVLADEPDAATVGEALAAAAGEARDTLLVYYAGHGLTWTNRNELYLALRGTRPHTVGTSALRCADVRQVFLDSTAGTRVLILDCCFSGRAIEQGMAAAADALLGEVEVEGAYILAATEGPRMALAPAGQRHTLFTGELLRLLREGIPGGPALLTLDALYRELRATLRRRNQPVPSCSASASAAHLALAPNPAAGAGTVGEDGAALEVALVALAAAEEAAARAYAMAVDRIAEVGLPPPAGRVAALRARLREGADPASLSAEVAGALSAATAAREAAQGLVERREELRGRLRIYLAMAVRLGVGEHPEVATRYARARDLLWTRPADLRAATRAVLAYQQAVTERQGRAG